MNKFTSIFSIIRMDILLKIEKIGTLRISYLRGLGHFLIKYGTYRQ